MCVAGSVYVSFKNWKIVCVIVYHSLLFHSDVSFRCVILSVLSFICIVYVCAAAGVCFFRCIFVLVFMCMCVWMCVCVGWVLIDHLDWCRQLALLLLFVLSGSPRRVRLAWLFEVVKTTFEVSYHPELPESGLPVYHGGPKTCNSFSVESE